MFLLPALVPCSGAALLGNAQPKPAVCMLLTDYMMIHCEAPRPNLGEFRILPCNYFQYLTDLHGFQPATHQKNECRERFGTSVQNASRSGWLS